MFGQDGPGFGELWRQAMSSTRAGYDLLAPKFDATPFRTPDALLEAVAGHLRAGPRIGSLLDVCCGTGAAVGHLGGLAERAVGLDFSPGMLSEARRRLGDDPVELVLGDAMALPYEAEFDLITSFGAFGHIQPPQQAEFLRGVRRALKPGGRFVFVTAPPPGLTRPAFWVYRGFNAAMHVRNWLVDPPFMMFYFNFMLPDALARLIEAGFRTETIPLGFAPRPALQLVIGHREADDAAR